MDLTHQIEVIGKNLFYFFAKDSEPPAVLHFHFGMSGAFKTFNLPGPDPKPTTRLQLVNEDEDVVAQLSAMTVALGDEGGLTSPPSAIHRVYITKYSMYFAGDSRLMSRIHSPLAITSVLSPAEGSCEDYPCDHRTLL